MSSETQPINPARFSEALKELPAASLALKVLELRNSIAHLDYSNEELKPFAEGRQPTVDQQQQSSSSSTGGTPDQDCVDAIAENEAVIARMQERIELIRAEVEGRGMSWRELQDAKIEVPSSRTAAAEADGAGAATTTNGTTANGAHEAWSDGTFQTGTIRGGGAGMSDEELLRQLMERMPDMQARGDNTNNNENGSRGAGGAGSASGEGAADDRDDDEGGGLHL